MQPKFYNLMSSIKFQILLLSISFFFSTISATYSQTDSTSTFDLPTVKLTALRIAAIPRKQPFSIATFQMNPILANGQQMSLQEYLSEIPGLFSLNANNYSQDLRLSIRGFGARSAFGIRGIKLIVDGIPETTPDGQGQLDNLNLSNIQRIEILKGPSSALYGNASGGVINISTNDSFDKYYGEAGVTFGSFGMQRYQLKTGIKYKNGKISLRGLHSKSNGFRESSGFQTTNFELNGSNKIFKNSKLTYLANYTNSPIADDPGGLDLESVEENRKAARDRNVLFEAGEAIDQFKVGSTLEIPFKVNQKLKVYGFYNNRNFEGRLPFEFGGWIDLNRQYFGSGISYAFNKKQAQSSNKFLVGIDQAYQLDQRMRFQNLEGTKGELTLDQNEIFSNVAIYALNHFTINKLMLSAGIRFDQNNIILEDEKTVDGDQSGERSLPSFNPSIGLNYEIGNRQHLYGSFRSSFETPALSELTANPSGQAGLNPNLDAQQSYNYEMGYKGMYSEKFDFDFTLFHINTTNDLVPYEIEAFPGRTFFRNAGSTTRQGFEYWIQYRLLKSLSIRTASAFSKYKYKAFELGSSDLSGKELPGLPFRTYSASLNYQSKNGISARIIFRKFSAFFADDSNQVEIPGYSILDINFGYRHQFNKVILNPFFGINNLLDSNYYDNIRLNAFGSRYYEAAAGIHVFGGIRIRFE